MDPLQSEACEPGAMVARGAAPGLSIGTLRSGGRASDASREWGAKFSSAAPRCIDRLSAGAASAGHAHAFGRARSRVPAGAAERALVRFGRLVESRTHTQQPTPLNAQTAA